MRASALSSGQDRSPFLDRFAALLEHAPVMVWMAGADGQCVYVNERWLSFRGRTREQEVGPGWADGLHPDDRNAFLTSFAEAVAQQTPFERTIRCQRADGAYRLIHASAIPVSAAAGELDGYVGSCVDIDEQRGAAPDLRDAARDERLEQERHTHLLLWNSLVAHMRDGVLVESEAGRVLLANEAFCRLFNLAEPPEALVGTDVRTLTAGILGPAAARLDELRRDGGRIGSQAIHLGDGRVLELEYSPIAGDARSAAAHVWQYRDITARTHFEAELHVSRQRLRDLVAHEESVREEERRSVARMLHDELGQLLTSIKLELGGATELVRSRRAHYSAAVVDRLQSAGGLLDVSLATVQRVSARVRPAMLGPLGFAEALRYEALLFETRTKIRCRVSVTPPHLEIDPERASILYRILLEALTNVARHAAAGAVQISLKKDGRVVSLSVRDNGRGIAPEQIENPRTMGLLGMRERALAVGGDVRITSGGGRGTVVMAIVPLPPTQPSADPTGTGTVSA
jgi:PAS domain S-box-containing protein